MIFIISYRKHIDSQITRELRLPADPQGMQPLGTELATINGITYVSLPDGATLPANQPAEISASIAEVVLTAALRDAIKAASPHVRLIRAEVKANIAAVYSLSDEIKLLRTAPSVEFDAYNAFAEDCRAQGREKKAALGL